MTSRWRLVCFALVLNSGLPGCWSAPAPPVAVPAAADGSVWFEDITDMFYLDFVYDPGPVGTYFLPQVIGSGCAFIHDGDGTI